MPNVVHNSMKITGAAEDIARFKQTCIIDGQFERNAHAWDLCLVKDETDRIEYSFETAWQPPIPVWGKMAEMFPTLDFELEGVDVQNFTFSGTISGGHGEIDFQAWEDPFELGDIERADDTEWAAICERL